MPEAVSLMADVLTVSGSRALVTKDLARAESIVSKLLLPETTEPERRKLFAALAKMERTILSRFSQDSLDVPMVRLPKQLRVGLNLARGALQGTKRKKGREVFVFERGNQ